MTAARNRVRTWRAALGIVLVSFAGALAQQSYDLQSGDYLTPEEYKKLSKDEALAYCQKLVQEIDIQNDNAAAANSQMGDIDAEIASLRSRLDEAKAANMPLAGRVAELEAKLKELTDLPRSYTVVPGDYLVKISGRPRIYNDSGAWKRIYRANKDKIRDPNLIYPDQILLIPRGQPSSHVVAEGETLRRIAGYSEIYGDPEAWSRIFDANRDKLSDPNVLPAGVELAIPR